MDNPTIWSPTMDAHLDNLMRTVARHWSHATPTDFGALALTIVIASWFFTRFYGDR
jgi:hypothetical protein